MKRWWLNRVSNKLMRRRFLGCVFSEKNNIVYVKKIVIKGALLQEGDIIRRISNVDIHSKKQLDFELKKNRENAYTMIYFIRDGLLKKKICKLFLVPFEKNNLFNITYDYILYHSLKFRIITTGKRTGNTAILLLQGIDCSSIDRPFEIKNTYRDIMYNLTGEDGNFSTVRVDLFGNGDSEGANCADYSFNDILDLYDATIKKLAINNQSIVLFGYSMGGIMAPILAQRNPRTVKSIIIFDTLLSKLDDYLIRNRIRQALLQGKSKKEIVEDSLLFLPFIDSLLYAPETLSDILKQQPLFCKYTCDGYFHGHNELYYRQINELCPIKEFPSIPILFLVGKNDYAISYDDYLQTCREIKSYKGSRYKVATFNMDHSFFDSNGVVCQEAILGMKDFIKSQVFQQ